MGIILLVIAVVAAFLIYDTTASAASTDSTNCCGGCCCMILSPSQIAQYARNAGFEGADLITAVAIALAESGGKVAVVGDKCLGVSIGLWQVNERWHPEYTQSFLNDPQNNANAAFAIYSAAGNSFTPWSTFKNGAYQSHLNTANEAVNA
jgi:hypothetical protein